LFEFSERLDYPFTRFTFIAFWLYTSQA